MTVNLLKQIRLALRYAIKEKDQWWQNELLNRIDEVMLEVLLEVHADDREG